MSISCVVVAVVAVCIVELCGHDWDDGRSSNHLTEFDRACFPTMIYYQLRVRSTARVSVRNYATRRPERPARKIKDVLDNAINANRVQVQDNSQKFTFIHRSPPSAPTPFSLTTAPASPLLKPATITAQPLPPQIPQKITVQHRTLSESEIDSVRQLRSQDPLTYTASKLAAQFGCSSKFIALVAPLSKEVKRQKLRIRDEEHQDIRSKWGPRKQLVKEIREKRRSYW